MSAPEYDRTYAERQLARSRHPLRRQIKRFYLDNILKDVLGAAIDFGCGAGQLLSRLPAGSLGLEVNPHLVKALSTNKLNVLAYDPNTDQLEFRQIPKNSYQTFIMSHVLEHFDDAAGGLNKILRSCFRLGIHRIIIVVPGEKGFTLDDTHRTFVNKAYLSKNNLQHCQGYHVSRISHFPINIERIGKYYSYHELKIIYDRT